MAPEARENCGVFGVYGDPAAAHLTYMGLFALQHRGQESAGIVASDGERLESVRRMGLVSEVFEPDDLEHLRGHLAIGHVRYSTTGSSRIANIQPLVISYSEGLVAVAHNGTLVNARLLRDEFEARGSIFQTSTDSEIILHLMATPQAVASGDSLAAALKVVQGAYSLVIMTKSTLIGARDPQGFRPLVLGRGAGGAYLLASETCAFDLVGAELVREIAPGEIVRIGESGLQSQRFAPPKAVQPAQCIFEHIYFARPDSRLFGESVHQVRMKLGRVLAREHPCQADIVIPMPDSGNSAALGYSLESGIPLDFGFIRNHYVGRTFIQPDQADREGTADIKLNIVQEVVKGKRVVVVDDSLVRGTTMKRRARDLKTAGAREVHIRISCPPHRFPCYYGIDFPNPKELFANQHGSPEEMRAGLGVESLAYVSRAGLLSAVSQSENYCTCCFFGQQPVPVEDRGLHKLALEPGHEPRGSGRRRDGKKAQAL